MRFGTLAGAAGPALLALVALVVLGLYLLRPPPQRLVVPSTFLWERVLARTRSVTQRLRWWLSLLLALAIALALAAAWLRPERDAGAARERPLVIVVDNGGTMGALRADGRTRLAHAIEAARREVAGPGRYLVLDTMRTLAPAGYHDREHALSRLEGIAVAPGAQARFPDLAAVLAEGPAPEVVFVTDGVAQVDAPPMARTVSVFEPAANLGITAFDVRPLPADASRYEALVEVGNAATAAIAATVKVSGAGRDPIVRAVTVPARGFASVSLPVSGFEGGALRATLEAAADALPEDDEAWAFLPFHRRLKVALVTTGNAPLERALRLDPRVQLTVLPPAQYARRTGFDAYVLDRFAPPAAPAAPVLAFAPPAAPWLPARAGERERVVARQWVAGDPVLDQVSLADAQAERAVTFRPVAPWTALATLDDGTALIAASDAAPRVVVVGFALQGSSFTAQASFPVFIANALAWLDAELPAVTQPVGPIRLPLEGARVTGLDAGPVTVRSLPGATLFTAAHPDFFTAEAGGRRMRVLVNVTDPAITDVNASRLLRAAPAADTGAAAVSGVTTEPWLVLLAVAGLLMLGEWLAYHRRWTV